MIGRYINREERNSETRLIIIVKNIIPAILLFSLELNLLSIIGLLFIIILPISYIFWRKQHDK